MILVCVFQPIWLAVAHAQQTPPTVDVFFEIAAEPFKSNLSPQQREKIESDIARELAHLCSDPIAYLNWREAHTMTPRIALKVVLRHERAGYNNEIYLHYISLRGSQQIEWPRDPKETVYQPFALSLPTHRPEQLEADLLSTIRTNFANEDFRKLLHDRLAATVPITETIGFDPTTQRCILPFSWESLKAADSSVLLASFQARSPQDSQTRPVEIRMAPERWDKELKCRVLKFSYPPTLLEEQPGLPLNDRRIPESLRDRVGQAAVYMEKYVRDYRANTSGPLNATP
jgi:hypothetical protein